MHHSTWDLEVHAREMQQRRWREATRTRQIEEARCRAGVRRPSAMFSVARLVTAARTWLSPRRASVGDPADSVEAPMASEVGLRAMRVAAPPAKSGLRPNLLSQQYAGMVVLARGTDARATEQPCGVADC